MAFSTLSLASFPTPAAFDDFSRVAVTSRVDPDSVSAAVARVKLRCSAQRLRGRLSGDAMLWICPHAVFEEVDLLPYVHAAFLLRLL